MIIIREFASHTTKISIIDNNTKNELSVKGRLQGKSVGSEKHIMLTFRYYWLYFCVAVYAIIVGAGSGRRFGGLKQFINFRGKPLLVYTAEIFSKNSAVDSIIVVVPANMIAKVRNMLKNNSVKKINKVVAGGQRRQDSVMNGLRAINRGNGIVIIHDAVRPFVSQKLISKGIRLCKKYRAVVFGLPIFDTIKLVQKERILQTVPRISPYAVQTPQFFELGYLRKAYRVVNAEKEIFTDEAAIVEAAGMPVYLFRGEAGNIKITTRNDLKKMECC